MKSRKGFTLIELMIVIAIIAIIAAIAIPNLMQSRIRANEATAVTALKNYCTAQVTYQVGKQGRVTENTAANGEPTAYCFVYPNLFFGNPAIDTGGDTTTNLALISKAHAEARVDSVNPGTINDGNPTAVDGNGAYQGYFFSNAQDADADETWYETSFAQVGAPALSSSTGNNIYWVGVEGTVYFKGLPKGQDADTSVAQDTPITDFTDWLSL